MNHFNLRRAITEGNRSRILYNKSMLAAIDIINGKNVKVFSPTPESAKEFLEAVKCRLKEYPPGKDWVE